MEAVTLDDLRVDLFATEDMLESAFDRGGAGAAGAGDGDDRVFLDILFPFGRSFAKKRILPQANPSVPRQYRCKSACPEKRASAQCPTTAWMQEVEQRTEQLPRRIRKQAVHGLRPSPRSHRRTRFRQVRRRAYLNRKHRGKPGPFGARPLPQSHRQWAHGYRNERRYLGRSCRRSSGGHATARGVSAGGGGQQLRTVFVETRRLLRKSFAFEGVALAPRSRLAGVSLCPRNAKIRESLNRQTGVIGCVSAL